jgi:rRNA maturation endonuclease Nob1
MYQAGKNKVQFRCVKCKTVSPHKNKCFVCGSDNKVKEIVAEIKQKRDKGQSINIKMR